MKRVKKFRVLADNMQKIIDGKLNSGTANQNLTARRARIIESMRKDGERLKKIQAMLRGMADDIEACTLPEVLNHLQSKQAVDDNLSVGPQAVKDALMVYVNPATPEEVRRLELQKLEHGLLGTKIPGLFPTPEPLIDIMLSFADIKEHHRVLEPSAGKGDIADAITERFPGIFLDVIEINYTLSKILTAKGYLVKFKDFLQCCNKPRDKNGYDRIVMNPPFENGQDAEHLRHAYSLLCEGGRVVSILGEGIFFRSDKKAIAFREWFESVGGYCEKAEAKSFTGSKSFRQTGVASRIAVIDKRGVN